MKPSLPFFVLGLLSFINCSSICILRQVLLKLRNKAKYCIRHVFAGRGKPEIISHILMKWVILMTSAPVNAQENMNILTLLMRKKAQMRWKFLQNKRQVKSLAMSNNICSIATLCQRKSRVQISWLIRNKLNRAWNIWISCSFIKWLCRANHHREKCAVIQPFSWRGYLQFCWSVRWNQSSRCYCTKYVKLVHSFRCQDIFKYWI